MRNSVEYYDPLDVFYRDGVLVGFRISLGKFFKNDVIKFIQPIYLTPKGETWGIGHGIVGVELMIIPGGSKGYAIYAITIRGGGGLDAITVTFMRMHGKQLDPGDVILSTRIGDLGGGENRVGGDGSPIIGIQGRSDDKGDWLGLGVISVNQPQPPILSPPQPSLLPLLPNRTRLLQAAGPKPAAR